MARPFFPGCPIREQRLSFLAFRLRVLMLDEGSTALDLPAEIRVLNGICQFLQKITPLFVSHRLANTDLMGRILVFHRGTIVEDGGLLAPRRARSIYTELLRTSQRGIHFPSIRISSLR
jgi:ABC-type transport system involved in cytochrome bd biosynthesis fused ATPase/permease subunit